MRFETNPKVASVGSVDIHGTYVVKELDAGHFVEPHDGLPASGNVAFSHETLRDIETQLAIVIPCMKEDRTILDGVLHGVPHECLIIIVSNSDENDYREECILLQRFCEDTDRTGIIVHQKDKGLAAAFLAAGMKNLVDEEGRVRNGKGEGMMIGVVIAKLKGKAYVGFIDADNRVPGSVHEYCKVYAAGLHHATNAPQTQTDCDHNKHATDVKPHSMVRIKWNSKPKIQNGQLEFATSGRCSILVNQWMNEYLNAIVKEPSSQEMAGTVTLGGLIETANAGEHAMDIDLAFKLRFARDYAVEPFQLVDLLERYGDQLGDSNAASSTSARKINVLQVKTRNPHIHDIGKGEEHIWDMQVQGLGTIFHSKILEADVKARLQKNLTEEFSTKTGPNGKPLFDATGAPKWDEPYSPLEGLRLEAFEKFMENTTKSMEIGQGIVVFEKGE
ncbi:hypothetical protein IQ07DRAFT_666916 [Pyrenochaeta sp. DS3sAY3a]|nr:hypothetical protein IQ07DRAFT_666916 [Pyrenochaeta sp. DS3sAY3a]